MFGLGTKKHAGALAPALRQAIAPAKRTYDLNRTLLSFTAHDHWTLRDAFQGTTVFGGTGSGKTTGSGRALAHAFLREGFGGMVLCAKPDERALWQRYARETGRENSLIVFGPDGTRRFNFLDYELRRGDRLATHNLVSLFMRIMEVAKNREGEGGGNEAFWKDAASELLGNAFLVLYSAWGTVTLADLMKLIGSAPQSREEAKDEDWRKSSFCFECLWKMMKDPAHPIAEPDAVVAGKFFSERWPRLGDRTRSSIEFTLSGLAAPFLTGYLREMFCTTTNTLPEFAHQGAVIVIDLPVKEHGESGILAQHVWKYLFQRAAERRNAEADPTARPLFLWADECQFFMAKYDKEFQSTARGSKTATVYMTQSLSEVYDRIGGRTPEHSAHALLNNFQTRIFHQNSDAATNSFAADLIGREWLTLRSHGSNRGGGSSSSDSRTLTTGTNSSYSGGGGKPGSMSFGGSAGKSRSETRSESAQWGTSENYTQQVEHVVLPSTFARLRQGGRGGHPQAFVVQGGRAFSQTGGPHMLCEFPQS